MKITALEVTSFKRIDKIRIEPGERSLLYIGGKNRAGKSSVLDALTTAFGGKRAAPEKAVREGADSAGILVELDDGALVIRRRISAAGAHQLEVSDPGGGRKKPQQILDKLRGQLLDPLAFLALSAKEQRETLLKLVDVGIDLDAWEATHRETYNARTEIGRDVRRLEGELAGLPEAAPVERVDISSLVAKKEVLLGKREEHRRAKEKLDDLCERAVAVDAEIADLRQRLAAKEAEREEFTERIARGTEYVAGFGGGPDAEDIATLQQQIEAGQEANEAAARVEAAAERRVDVASALLAAKTQQSSLTGKLNDLERTRSTALAAAEMPVPGLDVGPDGLLLNGQPFSQASGAEQLTTAVSIAMALSPEIHDVWIKDGALLDEDSLALIRRLAEERNFRLWLERVGSHDEGAIIIEDGGVVGADAD